MPNTYKNAPYYDDYDPKKGYIQTLAVPGRAEQAREFTQIQSAQLDFLGRLGDSLYSSGTIIEGCNIVINDKKVVISSGRIYLNGLIRIVDGTVLNINGVGIEIIGAKIKQSIITETEDATLRDPAQGYENFGQEGAHRVKEEVIFTVNDDLASTIYRLNEGELISDATVDNNNLIVDTLARRTYEESGNYKIRGLVLRDRNETRDGQILISVTEGKAYIKGYEVEKIASSTVKINYSQTTREILSEPKVYQEGQQIYKLNNQPAKNFTRVVAVVRITNNITRGNIQGGIDYLPNTPVDSVQNIPGYTNGVDYQLTNDGIDWSLRGAEPLTGATYSVTYTYNKIMKLGTDIKLTVINGESYLEFVEGGNKPVLNSKFYINYDFYLSRKDLVCLSKNNELSVIEGKPDVTRLCESEINQDDNQLVLGSILVYPNSSNIEIINFDTIRLSQNDLYKLRGRVDDMEYNQAMTDLDKEAEAGENATNLKGIFTDGFLGITKCDTTHPEFDCTIDLDSNELTLPIVTSVEQVSPNLNTNETNISIIGNVLMAPYDEEVAKKQIYATSSMLVNPYAVYNPMCLVELSPSVDNWVDSSKVIVNKQETTTTTLRRWWYHRGEAWAEAERQKWIQAGFNDGGASLEWSDGKATNTEITSNVILDEAIMFMRQIKVNVTGANFTPFLDNIECYFNDSKVPLIPTNDTEGGTQIGTIKASSKGTFTASFTVPPNTPCGTVEVLLKGATSSGSTIFQAQGRRQLIQDTVLTTTTVVKPTDPLAQSFSFEEDTVLIKAGLYFGMKDTDKAIVVQIRNMVNGYPGTTCYTSKVVNAEDIKVSGDSSEVTLVKFEKPVYCKADEQYAICILSDSNLYSMYLAELGQKDIQRGTYVTSQPYTSGVLFSSSNNLTWTSHQTMDLKFDLYKANFKDKGTIVFDDVTDIEINRLLLAAQAIDYKNAGIEWFYKISNAWLPIETYVDRDIQSSTNTTKVSIKAVLHIEGGTSPILSKDCMNLIGFLEKSKGTYVSRNVKMSDRFNRARVIMDVAKPSGTDVRVYIKTDGWDDWQELNDYTSTEIDGEFNTYEYNTFDEMGSYNYRIKITMESQVPLVRPRIRKLRSILKY